MRMFVSRKFALMALSCCIVQLAQAQNAAASSQPEQFDECLRDLAQI